jgi:uncharacterized protein
VLGRFLRSEIGAVLLWILGSLCLAAAITPWVCRSGQWLAAAAIEHEFPIWIEWLAESCGRAKLSRFFDRSLLLSSLSLLPWLVRRIQSVRKSDLVPVVVLAPSLGWKSASSQVTSGFLMAAVGLALLCGALVMAGAYEARPLVGGAPRFVQKVILPSLVAASVEEWLFRGLLLGIWLRYTRPWSAILGTSVVFSLLHFLDPPAAFLAGAETHPLAGFRLFGGILAHFTDPLFFVTDFATLLLVGGILGWARWRTGSLWFGMGMHAGWIMVLKSCSFFYIAAPEHFLRPWWVGSSLKSGILPLLVLSLTAVISAWWLRGAWGGAASAAQECDGENG